jgi:hypothetical protein
VDLIVSIEVSWPDIEDVSDDIARADEVCGDEVSQPVSAIGVDFNVEGASIHPTPKPTGADALALRRISSNTAIEVGRDTMGRKYLALKPNSMEVPSAEAYIGSLRIS